MHIKQNHIKKYEKSTRKEKISLKKGEKIRDVFEGKKIEWIFYGSDWFFSVRAGNEFLQMSSWSQSFRNWNEIDQKDKKKIKKKWRKIKDKILKRMK